MTSLSVIVKGGVRCHCFALKKVIGVKVTLGAVRVMFVVQMEDALYHVV